MRRFWTFSRGRSRSGMSRFMVISKDKDGFTVRDPVNGTITRFRTRREVIQWVNANINNLNG